MLHYKTFFAEYSGETPEDVIQAVYADAKSGTGMTFPEWWQYQKDVWALKYEEKIPEMDEPDAAGKLLEILVHLGALESAAKPQPKKSSFIGGM